VSCGRPVGRFILVLEISAFDIDAGEDVDLLNMA
jgi:hypothetical protein